MATIERAEGDRPSLNRDRVVRAAIDLADRDGLEGLSMRKLGADLGVEAMSLYNHVANKDDLLDAMVDAIVEEIELPPDGPDWKEAVKQQMLNARQVILQHAWSARAIETRSNLSPALMDYIEHFGATLRAGGFSVDLLHHAMHAFGSRAWGFSQEMFTDRGDDNDETTQAVLMQQMAQRYPILTEVALSVTHDMDSVPGGMACDDDWEFEFAIDLLLDGLERKLQADHPSA